ncbi:MAG: GreA/GreB family elongation factor [Bacteroidetes bacterium]|nr:GreA/GreB family elongation factor [Bacteroidota bacterium]
MSLAHAQASIQRIKGVMDDAQGTANEYGAPKDRYDSFRNQQISRGEMFAKKYNQSLSDYYHLKKVNPDDIHEKIEFGSVVETNLQTLFICCGFGKIESPNLTFYAISKQVPVFAALEGKKKGDTAIFRGQTIKILDVY